jgi:serine/threonine protein kinase
MSAAGQVGEPLSASDPPQVGPYEILRRLGAGAMGRVYLGRTGDGQLAAVKIVRSDHADAPDFRRRFGRELDVIRRVGGERVARVLDADAEAEQPWIATEWINGPSLQDYVSRRGALTSDWIRALAGGVAEALWVIHDAGVIHRDLKPANVLLTVDGPKVVDFGVAHAADATALTPEQADGQGAAVPASDVFSLGSLLAFAATGGHAFSEGQADVAVHQVMHREPNLDGVAEEDPELRQLIEDCLQKDPSARPTPARIIDVCHESAAETAADGLWARELADFVSAGPMPGHGPGPALTERPRSRRRSGRKAGILIGIAIVILGLLGAALAEASGGDGAHGEKPPTTGASPGSGAAFALGGFGDVAWHTLD